MKKILSVILIFVAFQNNALAEPSDIIISNEWARPILVTGRPGGAYFTVENKGTEADRLVSVTSTISPRLEIHEHTMKDGVMKMSQVDYIEVGPGENVELKPGGYHIMIFDTATQYKEGDQIDLTLHFEKAGAITKTVNVTSTAPNSKN
ncbi:MAG: copper chaperone PCu(A)C [Kordiimonadaceae bacterium]|nr:copper chaperone PCu(A)C [Kordiimonadaceae bacterium]